MNSRLVNNRVALNRLIFDLGEFSEQELVNQFWRSHQGEVSIDGDQTISDYLQELRSLGTLSFQYDRYSVVMRRMRA